LTDLDKVNKMSSVLNVRTCKVCKVIKNIREFPLAKTINDKDSNGNPYRRYVCGGSKGCYSKKKCEQRRIRTNERRFDIKNDLACEMCTYSRERDGDYFVTDNLQFHHHEDNKSYNIADMWNMPIKRIKQEIAKCTVLCMLCHGFVTAQERKGVNNE